MSPSDAISGKNYERRRTDNAMQSPRAGDQMVTTAYSPERYAFRFPNTFTNAIWSGRIPPLIGRKVSIATSGRCGGMAFASLDFFYLKKSVPTLDLEDAASLEVPADGHPLADYLYTRQLHSMLTRFHGVRDGLRYLQWSGDSTAALIMKTTNEERKVVESLDRGQPVVLGLIKATNRRLKAQGGNHQVVCYGYTTNAAGHREFYIYDPNEPFRPTSKQPYSVVLGRAADFERAEFPYQARRSQRIDRWRGFFVVGYRPYRPAADVLRSQHTKNR